MIEIILRCEQLYLWIRQLQKITQTIKYFVFEINYYKLYEQVVNDQ